jgi:hypothetical protein
MATIPEWESPSQTRETQSGPATIKRAARTAVRRHLLRFAAVALLVLLATGQMQMSAPLAAFNGVTTPTFLAGGSGGGNPPPPGACGGGAGLPC